MYDEIRLLQGGAAAAPSAPGVALGAAHTPPPHVQPKDARGGGGAFGSPWHGGGAGGGGAGGGGALPPARANSRDVERLERASAFFTGERLEREPGGSPASVARDGYASPSAGGFSDASGMSEPSGHKGGAAESAAAARGGGSGVGAVGAETAGGGNALTIAQKVGRIKEELALDPAMPIAKAVGEANALLGLEGGGPIARQVETLLTELGVM